MLPTASAKTVALGWESNDEPDLEGYVIYRNTNSPGPPYSYSDTLPEDELADPLHPRANLTGLQEGKEYYIALTAYNTEGVESSFSNEICAEVVNDTIELCSASASAPVTTSSSGSGGGSSSSGCFISSLSNKPASFTPSVIKPPIKSQVLVLLFLLLVLLTVVKLRFKEPKG
jgi:hypothetical protein